jgi:hypothetical protein
MDGLTAALAALAGQMQAINSRLDRIETKDESRQRFDDELYRAQFAPHEERTTRWGGVSDAQMAADEQLMEDHPHPDNPDVDLMRNFYSTVFNVFIPDYPAPLDSVLDGRITQLDGLFQSYCHDSGEAYDLDTNFLSKGTVSRFVAAAGIALEACRPAGPPSSFYPRVVREALAGPPRHVRDALRPSTAPAPTSRTPPKVARAILDGAPLPPLAAFTAVAPAPADGPPPTAPPPRSPGSRPTRLGLRPVERAGPVPYDWVTVGGNGPRKKKQSFAAAVAAPPAYRPVSRAPVQVQTQLQGVATSANPRLTLAVDADTRRHLMGATEAEIRALWKQRFGKNVPPAYKTKASVVEAYLLGKPSSTAPRAPAPPQLLNSEWTVTRNGKYVNADRVTLPRADVIVRDLQRALDAAGCTDLTLLGGRWSSNEMVVSANFVLVFGGRPDPAEVMRHADILSAPFGIGAYLVPKFGFSRIRLFNVPVHPGNDTPEDLMYELERNPGLQDLRFIDKPRWMFKEERRRADRDQVIFTIFDPRNVDTPKIVKRAPYMFGVRCRGARFDSRPMLRQCDRCHRLGHSVERCPRPSSLIKCRHCGGGHLTEDHVDRCRTKASHKARGGCDCPRFCINCKDAGKPEKGHRANDDKCPLRTMYRTPFSPEYAPAADDARLADARLADAWMASPSPPPAVASGSGARIDDSPLASPAPAGTSVLPLDLPNA